MTEAYAAAGLCADSNQAATVEAEVASWCTTLYVKCSKTKKSFMVRRATISDRPR